MNSDKAIFIYEEYNEMVDPRNDYLAEDISNHIAKHFNDLSQVISPRTLVGQMSIPDIVYAHHEIKAALPDFDVNDYLDNFDFSEVKTFFVDLVELGVDVNRIVKKWPHLLGFEGKVKYGVNPDLILETEDNLNREKVTKLLDLGVNPNKAASLVYLSTAQMIKYGVDPGRIVRTAITADEMALVRVNLSKLLENGLDPEEFVRSELETVKTRSLFDKRFDVLWWYDEKLDMLAAHAKDKASFWDAYFELIEELIFGANIMDPDFEDAVLLRVFKKPVHLGLISLDAAVSYLCSIYDENDECEEEGPISGHVSILQNEQYVRSELIA